MELTYRVTLHAHERSTQRAIPPMIAETIIAYGRSTDAGDGLQTYSLTKKSLRDLKRVAGPEVTKAIASYQKRNAYVVVGADKIITVAFAAKPLFR